MFGWSSHFLGVALFLGAVLINCLANLLLLPRLKLGRRPGSLPLVSVLLPVRDEEENVEGCLRSVLSQDYPNLEVLVLNDGSRDGTPDSVKALSARDPRVRLLEGKELPPGWLGKSWACLQLYRESFGELLLFIDADVRLHPHCLSSAVGEMERSRSDLVTVYPLQRTETVGERLLLPLLGWSMLSFYPLFAAGRFGLSSITVTVGQFILVRKDAYERAGTHEAVRSEVVEDIALGRRLVRAGFRWSFALDGGAVECRMYRGFRETFQGLSRGVFPAFGGRVLLFSFIWLWLAWAYTAPVVFLIHSRMIGRSSEATPLAAACVFLSLAQWALPLVAQRRFPWLALVYPLPVLLGMATAFWSMYVNLAGKAEWKGRRLPRMRPRFP